MGTSRSVVIEGVKFECRQTMTRQGASRTAITMRSSSSSRSTEDLDSGKSGWPAGSILSIVENVKTICANKKNHDPTICTNRVNESLKKP